MAPREKTGDRFRIFSHAWESKVPGRSVKKRSPGSCIPGLGLSKTPGRCRRGRNPSDFHSYPPALPAGRVVDFACKINSLHLRTTSGWPKVLPRKSGENHFFDTLKRPCCKGRFLFSPNHLSLLRSKDLSSQSIDSQGKWYYDNEHLMKVSISTHSLYRWPLSVNAFVKEKSLAQSYDRYK